MKIWLNSPSRTIETSESRYCIHDPRICPKIGHDLPNASASGIARKAGAEAFTLIEVVISLALSGLIFGSILAGYLQTAWLAEWSGYSLAAQSLGVHQLEQARAAVWDYSIGKNEITNLGLTSWTFNTSTKVGKGYTTRILDVPISGTNAVIATNFVTVRMYNVASLTNVQIQMVTVDTVWPFRGMRGNKQMFTNRTATYYAPDNRDVSGL